MSVFNLGIIAPEITHVQRRYIQDQLQSAYHQWKAAHEATLPEFKIENIRFAHDPRWNQRFFSIQSAHDGDHWVWKATKIGWLGIAGGLI